MALEIGVAYLTIIPSTRGMIREIKRSLNDEGGRVARNAGRNMGEQMSRGVEEQFRAASILDEVTAKAKKAEAAREQALIKSRRAAESAETAVDKVAAAEARHAEAVRRSGAMSSAALKSAAALREEKARLKDSTSRAEMETQRYTLASLDAAKADEAQRLTAEALNRIQDSRVSTMRRMRAFMSREQVGVNSVITLADGSETTLDARIKDLTQQLSRRHRIELDIDVEKSGFDRLRKKMHNGLHTGALDKFADSARTAFGAVSGVISRFVAQIPGTWIVLGVLGAIGAVTLTPLLASMSQLVNLLWLVPAVATGAAAAIATLAIGFNGVFAAIGAGAKASKAAGGMAGNAVQQQRAVSRAREQAARTAEDGAKRIAQAERGVARAQQEAAKAQDELNDARREAVRDLEDMNARLAESALNEESAQLQVRRSYESLRKTMGDPEASTLDRDEANLRYRESIQNLKEIRRENARLAADTEEANKAGVEGSEKVAQAKERVEAANEAVSDSEANLADTVRDVARANADAAAAIEDAATASQGAAGATSAFSDAMAELSPNAREFVEHVLALGSAWDQVKNTIQDNLLDGIGPALTNWANTYFPILEKGLGGFATTFNDYFHNVFERMKSPEMTGMWANMFENMRAGLEPTLQGFQTLTESFFRVAEIGSTRFPKIGEAIRDWSQGILDYINANPEKIAGWVDDALVAFGRLKTTVKEILRIVKNIFAPNVPDGDAMWDSLNNTLRTWADTLGTPEGQEKVLRFFSEIRNTVAAIADIIKGINEFANGGSPLARALGFSPRAEAGKDVSAGEAVKPSNVGRGSVLTQEQIAGDKAAWDADKARRRAEGHEMNPFKEIWGDIKDWGGVFKDTFKKNPNDERGMYSWDDLKNMKAGKNDARREQKRREMIGPMNLVPNLSDRDPVAPKMGTLDNFGPQEKLFNPNVGKLEGGNISAATPDLGVIDTLKERWTEWGTVFSTVYDTQIKPKMDGFNVDFGSVKAWFGERVEGMKGAWSGFSGGVASWYDMTIKPAFDRFNIGSFSMRDGWNTVTTVMGNAWGGLRDRITVFTDQHINPALSRLSGWAGSVRDKFHEVTDGIIRKWNELKGGTAGVINWVIEHVWNRGLVNAWNTARRFLPISEASPLPKIAGYHTGGHVTGPGTGTSDSILARLSNGEHVLTAAEVQAMGGHDAVYKMRAKMLEGKFNPRVNGGESVVPAFRDGGAVGDDPMAGGARLSPVPGEGNLRPIAVLARRLIFRIWKQITTIGGYRPPDGFNEHSSGRALDIMTMENQPVGDEINGWIHANRNIIPLIHTIWKQRWNPAGTPMGSMMPDRGNPTQNHFDHVHAWYKDVHMDPNIAPDGLVGHDGLTDEDRIDRIKARIREILTKILDPVGKGIGTIFSPPPAIEETPKGFYDPTRKAIEDKTLGLVDKLGDTLKSVYEKAKGVKDVVSNFFATRVPGLHRDTGGPLPVGTSLVTNETGKPEAILNWVQVEQIKRILADAIVLVRDLGGRFGAGDVASGIEEKLAKVDWEKFSLRIDAFNAQMGKITDTARTAHEDEFLSLFGLGNARKRFADYDLLRRGLSGEQVQGVPTLDEALAVGTTSGASDLSPLPEGQQKVETLKSEMPDIAEVDPTGSPVKDAVKAQFAKYGWDKEPFWSATDWIVGKESTWKIDARNPSSGAFGLFQFLGATKSAYLPDESRDPAKQGAAGAKYIKDRYGDPLKAKAFWERNGWYDKGGFLKPGMTLVNNETGHPEPVLTNNQWDLVRAQTAVVADIAASLGAPSSTSRRAEASMRGGDVTYNVHALDLDDALSRLQLQERQRAISGMGVR